MASEREVYRLDVSLESLDVSQIPPNCAPTTHRVCAARQAEGETFQKRVKARVK